MDAQQILFVEDDAIIASCACGYLRDRGMHVLEADGASAAAIVLARLPYLSGLVTDIDLGAGVDGFEIARRIREAYPDLPIVFVSGRWAWRERSEGVKNTVFIPKPYHPREIAEAFASLSPSSATAKRPVQQSPSA